MDMSQANLDAQIHLESVNATTSTDAQLIAYLKSMSSYSDTLIQTITQTFDPCSETFPVIFLSKK